jgi:site-specific DNA-methyltransferase (adenine-specific)
LEELIQIFELCAACLRGWLVSFLDWRYVSHIEYQPPIGLRFIRMGIWVKPNGAPQLSGDRPGMGWEAIAMLHNDKRRLKWNGGGHRAVWTCLREKRPFHPAQKPLSLVKRLASLFSDPGDTILDPFMGSGTVLRAARDIGCKAIGCELKERYCEIAANRLRQEVLF